MKKTAISVLVGFLITIIIVAITRGQVVSLLASAMAHASATQTASLFDEKRVNKYALVEPFTILAAGDIADCAVKGSIDRTIRNLKYSLNLERPVAPANEGMVKTTALLEHHPDANVFALGDLAYGRGEPAAFADCYDPYWGKAKSRTWPVPGNHEYKWPGSYGYYDYWQDRAGPDRQGYYALESQNWLILALNSEIDASPNSAQGKWLSSVLRENSSKCIGAFYHKPAFTTVARGDSENARYLFNKLAKAGAHFVLNGHNHFYERSKPLDYSGKPSNNGTVNFTVGTAGKTTQTAINPSPETDILITSVSGVLKMDFSPRTVAWNYLSTGTTKPADSGILKCF